MSLSGKVVNTIIKREEAFSGTYSKFVEEDIYELHGLIQHSALIADGGKHNFHDLVHNSVDCWLNGAEITCHDSASARSAVAMSFDDFTVIRENSDVDPNVVKYIKQFNANANVFKIFYFKDYDEFWIVVNNKQYDEVMKIRYLHVDFNEKFYLGNCLILRNEQIDYNSMPIPTLELCRKV